MKFKEFMDMYDNWNGLMTVNDDECKPIYFGKTMEVMEKRPDFYEREVVAFGFYDNELAVRIK